MRGLAVTEGAAAAPTPADVRREPLRAVPPPEHLNGEPIDPREVSERLESLGADEVIAWAIETFHPKLYFACSFQKTTSVVIDIAQRIDPSTRFFYLDTDLLFEQTYTTRDALAARFGIEFDRFHNIGVEEQARMYGDKLWARQPDACCEIRKVEPMRDALAGVDCWVSGIRREDSQTRVGAAKFGWDKRFGLWKLNPLADWTDEEVWSYINDNDVPYNPLHDAGYPSIGCTHCSRPPGNGAAPRDGRWANADKTECGLNG